MGGQKKSHVSAINFQEIVGLDDLVTPVWIYDTTHFCIYWANKRALELWGSESLDELRSRDFKPETSDAVHQTLLSYFENFERGEAVSRWWRLSPNGVVKDVFCQFSGVRLDCGRLAMLCEGLEMDVSQSEAFMSSAMIASTYDAEMRLISSNPTFKEIFGDQVQEFSNIMVNESDLIGVLPQSGMMKELTQDLMVNTLEGERWHSVHIRRLVHHDNQDACFLVTQSDIHQRKERELRHAQQAVTDALTGLCNRYALENRINRLIVDKTPFTLFYIDLDGFKPINDTYGHKVGDVILKGVAERLDKGIQNKKAIVCRLGGDEFVMTLRQNEMGNSAEHVAASIIHLLSKPYEIKEHLSLSISASVGIAHYPEHGAAHETLLASADAAMYAAKQRGRRRYVHYVPGMEHNIQRKMRLAQALPQAIEKQELSVHYQPIVDISTGEVEIVEGLIRWHSQMLGDVSAEETIEAAEDTGLISTIEAWVINQVCADLKKIREVLGSQVRMSVNISGMHLTEPGFITTLNAAVSRNGLLPRDLIVELTEGTLIPVAESESSPAYRLKSLGYHIAIDDFGTGYSSLAYLHCFPVSYVKIDKAFVERMLDDVATVSCINRLVSTLGMMTIAEGVELKTQIKLLRKQDVKLQQGYWFSRPVSLDELMTSFTLQQRDYWAYN